MSALRPGPFLVILSLILASVWARQTASNNATTGEKMLNAFQTVHGSGKLENSKNPKPFHRHIVAVGDLHGDMANARRVLEFSGVTDKNGEWSGKADFFVQTGDIIDRGDDTIELFRWMDQLRAQAAAVGGTVLSNLGNHEWMNAIGDWRYVYPTEIETLGGVEARQNVISTGWIGRSWAANYTTATRLPLHPAIGPPNTPYPPKTAAFIDQNEHDTGFHIDDHHPLSHAAISFVHGGLSSSYSNLAPFPSRINELGNSLLRKLQEREQPPPHPPNPYPGLPASATMEEHELYSSNGPLWYRGWAIATEDKVCRSVDEVLKKTGTRRMIMGHTPHFENIKSRCDGKIIIIDTGISHAYGGVLSALDIHYSLTPVIGANGVEKWVEEECVRALYPDHQEVIAHDTREVRVQF
ncbi:Metallo-dependent phosphatase-like protein [Amanita muscaria]